MVQGGERGACVSFGAMLNVCLTVFELSGGFALNYYFEKGESISLSIDRMEFFDDFLFSLCELFFYEGCNIF